MGRNFLNKLGNNILKVFKGVKRKDRDDPTDITSESGIQSSDSSSQQVSLGLDKKHILSDKSKSTESLVTTTTDSCNGKVNHLKRSNATCNIFDTTKENDFKCTKSLHRFGQLTHANQSVFSYNAKLHESTIWSRALGRAADTPRSTKTETTSSSTIPIDSETSQDSSVATSDFTSKLIEQIIDIREETHQENGTFNMETQNVEIIPTSNFINEDLDTKLLNEISLEENNTKEERYLESNHTKKENALKLNETVLRVQEQPTFPLRGLQESPKIVLDEKKVTLKMNVKTVQNEVGFGLLKYDVKSAGDHMTGNQLTGEYMAADLTQQAPISAVTPAEVEEKGSRHINSSMITSENTTEYEVVNLTQVDLFREFKTTISKMRNVLNVLDAKKSFQCVLDGKGSDTKIRKNITDILDGENISTQTTAIALNKISTSTECGVRNQTRNEGIMVQLSSETTSKRITLDSTLLKNIKPPVKRKKLKKRSYKCKKKAISKKTIHSFSSSYDGNTKNRYDKPRYNKCIVYHITQRKDAVDRCVGTPSPKEKEELVLKDTFSALHFGPIQQFPLLLDKHENERREKEKIRSPQTGQNKINHGSHRRKSTSYLSSDTTNNSKQENCLKSKTQPSLNCVTSRDFPFMSHSTTKANWLVFNPSPPIVVKKKPSSSDLILDKNRSSTQALVSNIIQEEFKTSGIKGKISSRTMNMIKNQFCDKLSGIKKKDTSDVMITVCVPLKSIVSKIKTTKKAVIEEEHPPSTETSTDVSPKLKASSLYDKGIQVSDSRSYMNLQTIPEKIGRKSTDIYQHNRMLRQSMSTKRLSTFKKIFGNKTISCSNVCPFGHLEPRTSRIYFSDHSTSSPDFAPKPYVRGNIGFANKKILTSPSSSLSLFHGELPITKYNKREGFFLNLPPHRYKKMRQQISKLFDSDSSERRYVVEPKLLYHVHESSFYSTSKTDDKFSSRRFMLSSSKSQEILKPSYFPVQEASSNVDLKVRSKFINFSNLQNSCESTVQASDRAVNESIEDKNQQCLMIKPSLKDVHVNTSDNRVLRDNETQFENVMSSHSLGIAKQNLSRKCSRKLINSADFLGKCINEFSMVSLPKVHFEDETNAVHCEKYDTKSERSERNTGRCNYGMQNEKLHFEEDIEEVPSKTASFLCLFREDDETPNENYENHRNRMGHFISHQSRNVESDRSIRRKPRYSVIPKKMQRNMDLQTSSDPHLIPIAKKDFGMQLKLTESIGDNTRNKRSVKLGDIVRVEATQVDSVVSLPKTENCSVQASMAEKPVDVIHDKKLSGLMREVVDLCNSSFVKSRDCIVELTLYNLIKEIILEHCSHLSEHSRQKVKSILANFIQVSKRKVGTENVDIVESAIENLVKEIGSAEFANKPRVERCEPDISLDRDIESDHRHRVKHYRSKSRRREHRNRHRESESAEQRERCHKMKHHHRHRYDDRFDTYKVESENKLKSVDGKLEYLELVQRLKELEDVTKQLSSAAENQNICHLKTDDNDVVQKNDDVKNVPYLMERPHIRHRRRCGCEKLGKILYKNPFNVNFFKADTENPILPIPRNYPKLPVTKIVINLSNLKLLTKNCSCLSSTSAELPIVITDSTERKQKLINKIVSYQVENGPKNKIEPSRGKIDEKKESFIITINGMDEREMHSSESDQPKMSKPGIRIKLVKQSKILTTTSDSSSDSNNSTIKKDTIQRDIQRITKECFKREYEMGSDILCASMAKRLLEDKYSKNQLWDCKENLDRAYQRMVNYCLFRKLFKNENC